jgi:hypothetical protein
VFISLDQRAVTAILSDESVGLVEVARNGLGGILTDEPAGWLEAQLQRGRCLVLIDGLDEVASNRQRELVSRWISSQFRRYQHTAFVVASRPLADRRTIPPAARVVELQPFTVEQVDQFVTAWSGRIRGAGIPVNDAPPSADALLSYLHETPSLWALAGNPLFLLMLVSLYEERRRSGRKPERPVEIYAEICATLLARREHTSLDLDRDSSLHVLASLALHMTRNHRLEIDEPAATATVMVALKEVGSPASPAVFLHEVAAASGLLEQVLAGHAKWRFAHRTFQEFLAAMALRHHPPDREGIAKLVVDPWWQDTMRFYAAVASEATGIVETCMERSPPSVDALVLAAECVVDEDAAIDPAVRARLEALLGEESGRGDAQRQRLLREVRLKLRLHRMARLGAAAYVSHTLLTNAEYQLFVDEVAQAGEFRHLDHWNAKCPRANEATWPAVGVRASDARRFCDWLSERDREGWRYRLPAVGELDQRQATRVSERSHRVPHWEQKEDGLTCLPKPDRTVTREFLARQLRFDVLQELSPAMRERINRQHWDALLRLVPLGSRVAPLSALDPQPVADLNLHVPAEALAALGVALAEEHDQVAAAMVADLLNVDQRTWAAARTLVGWLQGCEVDAAHLDPDTTAGLAAFARQEWRHDSASLDRTAVVIDAMVQAALDRTGSPEQVWRNLRVLRWGARQSALCLAVEILRLMRPNGDLGTSIAGADSWPDPVHAYLTVYLGLALIDARAQGNATLGSGLILAKEPALKEAHSHRGENRGAHDQ